MRKIDIKAFIFVFFSFLAGLYLVFTTKTVFAGDEACPAGQICYGNRTINQWSCETCGLYGLRCSGNKEVTCFGLGNRPECSPNWNPCVNICIDTDYIGKCKVLDVDVGCNNTGPGQCGWSGTLTDCVWSGGTCSEPSGSTFLSCCGPGGATNTPPPAPTSPPGPCDGMTAPRFPR